MIRYEVRFQTPYNSQEWRSQFFNTMKEAESMVSFLSLLWFKVLYGIIIKRRKMFASAIQESYIVEYR
jgi:hypothetical protein